MSGRVALTVQRAVPPDRAPVANLLQLYLHDFSEFGTAQDVDEAGLFAYPHFESYWTKDAARSVYVFRVDGQLAGFAFVNDWSPSGQGVDHALAEFFVLRAYRRSGIGWEAASRLFEALPALWEVAVAGPNVPAINFWRTALRAESIRGLQEVSGDGARWDGTIFRFRSEALKVD
jgi:predicted acetyltransferase